jgi:hypothetical protein
MHSVVAFLKKWITDGWLTEGPQIGCPPNQLRTFAVCLTCKRVFPHWDASMTAAEAQARGFLGCRCGGMKMQPVIIPAWQSVWWFVIRGWLIRHVLLRKRLWDPRIVALERELT